LKLSWAVWRKGVLAVDNEEKLINLNHSAAQLFGVRAAEAKGRNIQEIVRNPELQKFIAKILASKSAAAGEIVFFGNGERTIHVQGSLLQDERGQGIGALIVLNDITKQKQLENVRRDFVANVSHELKTPLTLIQGFVETLLDGALKKSSETKKFLGITHEHIDRLNAIIDDLLSLSRIEQVENSAITRTLEPLVNILNNSLQSYEKKIRAKRIGVRVDCSPTLLVKVNVNLFKQAISNLVENAVKYSDANGKIYLTGKKTRDGVIIKIEDNGCGIEPEHQSHIFERFYRVDKARSRKEGGTGLGLAIVKHIVQAHRGRITLESRFGHGTCFTIHLPSD